MSHSKDKKQAERSTSSTPGTGQHQSEPPSREQIERLAYAIWEARNGTGLGPEEDWFEAERRLRGEGLAANGRSQESRTTAAVS